jgi:hypothetical protein
LESRNATSMARIVQPSATMEAPLPSALDLLFVAFQPRPVGPRHLISRIIGAPWWVFAAEPHVRRNFATLVLVGVGLVKSCVGWGLKNPTKVQRQGLYNRPSNI